MRSQTRWLKEGSGYFQPIKKALFFLKKKAFHQCGGCFAGSRCTRINLGRQDGDNDRRRALGGVFTDIKPSFTVNLSEQ